MTESATGTSAFVQLLLNGGKISDTDLKRAVKVQQSSIEKSMPQLLVRLGLCSEQDVALALSEVTGLPVLKKEEYPLSYATPAQISERFLKYFQVVVLDDRDECLDVALGNPLDDYITKALQLATGKPVACKIGVLSDLNAALKMQLGEERNESDETKESALLQDDFADEDLEHLKDLASEAPVIKMVNTIMQRAVELRASDIHIEPFEEHLKIRFRVDGVLQDFAIPQGASPAAVLSRIKIMAKLNIAERRLPQDGRIKVQMLGRELDLRVATMPTLYGESAVIRLLDKESVTLDFSALGFSGAHSEQFFHVLAQPHGIILITGPTGSGKSTTLYTALKELNTSERKIISVEDPIEYQLEGINQIQAKPQIGLTFAAALRSIVRQDPDVIMIGEMRDIETARIAVQSALTGHLVLSTLHTNDAAGGITRLLDMGLEEYLLSSTINGILAQRLVRRLCPHCKQAYQPELSVINEFNLTRFASQQPIVLYQPKGCEACSFIGYKGREAIIEFLLIKENIRALIAARKEAGVIKQQAVANGMMTLFDDGIRKALNGATTLDEVLRVTADAS
jgi:general secretion pathway protein E